MIAADLFAGAGGWDCAARELGFEPLGIEWNHDACNTRRAANMPTVEADITTLDPTDCADAEGLIASPPCQSFSAAGKRRGLADDRGQLVWLPLAWAETIRPRWCAWEQVPAVEPIWRACAHRLEELGYHTAVAVLNAEQYGVPQTRRRAILLAHRDRRVTMPEPTHQRYVSGVPQGDPEACGHGSLFGEPLLPWVSMAEALGWGSCECGGSGEVVQGSGYTRERVPCACRFALRHPRGEGMEERHGERDPRPAGEPSMTLTGKSRSWEWVIRSGQYSRTAGGGTEEFTRPVSASAPTLGTMSPGQWVVDRPATTVTTDSRIGAPVHHDENRRSFSEDAIRLTVAEAAALQTFPPDHPWQGSKTAQHAQIGNAVPPMLARHVLQQVMS